MSEEEKNDQGLTVLSIDGGGIRGLSSLLILKECMSRLQHQLSLESMPEPYEHFDFVGGTGTGGISATMLGRLRVPLDDAIDEFAKLAQNVFSDKKHLSVSGSGSFKSTKLQQALKQIVREATGDENTRMMDHRLGEKRCKTVVFAMSKHNMNAGLPTPFRSYQALINQMQDCTIWEALCATTAHPDLFKSIDIGTGPVKESFVDGSLGCSNLLAHILAEVRLVYPDRHVGCVISVGSGHAQTIHIPQSSPFYRLLPTNVIVAMKALATNSERVAQDMAVRFAGTPGVYFRFNVDQGLQNMKLASWEQLSEVMAHTRSYMRHPDVSDAINRSAVAIKERQAIIPTRHINGEIPVATNEQTGIKLCPPPTSIFVGREQPVQQAVDYLLGSAAKRKVFVVHGLGGAGKTQMALRIVEKTREHWADIVYADATSVETIETTLKAFAELKSIGNTYQNTLQWLGSKQGRWLLVLDNADDPRVDVLKYIPDSLQGSILITTRNQDLLQLAEEPGSDYNLSSMEPEEAMQLLVKASRLEDRPMVQDDIHAAKALLEDLGHLPLAIVQVGGYIRRTRCSVFRYRELYLKQPEKMLQKNDKMRGKLDRYERTIFDAWVMSYDLLSLLAKRLLWVMAFMKRDQITLEIFRRAGLNIGQFKPIIPLSSSDQEAYSYVQSFLGSFIDSDGNWDYDEFLSKAGEILSFSLMEHDWVNETYVLHPLVQSWARMIAPHPLANVHTALTLAASLNWGAGSNDDAHCRSLQLHVTTVLQACPAPGPEVTACFANVLYKNGRWNETSPLQAQALQTREHILGKQHPSTLEAMHSLALTYNKQSHWKQAEQLYLQVIDARERVLSNKHPDTLAAMLDLADNYGSRGHLLQMEKLEVQVVNTRKRVLGEEHPDTLIAMNNLANTYRDQMRHKQAQDLYFQVVDAMKRVLGEEHPDTLSAICELSITYRDQGRYEQAEKLYLQVVDARKRVFGEEHPNTLAAILGLGITYNNCGNYKQAEALYLQVVDARKRVLGEEHPDTLKAILEFSITCSNQERAKEAEELCLQVVDARKQVLGEEHPDTLTAIFDLSVIYNNQGCYKQAEELCLQVVDARKRLLGKDHPETLTAILTLAVTYSDQGRYEQAEELYLQVVDARKRVLGEGHPDTLTATFSLASTFYHQNHYQRAVELYSQVADARKRVLGQEHPDTLTAMNNLSVTYSNQGRYKQAEELCLQVVDSRKRLLGEEHPDTLTAMENLAFYQSSMQGS